MLTAPFPFYGSKRYVVDEVWQRFGSPIQYIEPFCGSAAILLGAPKPASLEIINDGSGFIANFWRAVKYQPAVVARWADYPVLHVDLGARHIWLMDQREKLAEGLQDPNWPGDTQCAGWWLWGQCAWIHKGWCSWTGKPGRKAGLGRYGVPASGTIPFRQNPGQGIHSRQSSSLKSSSEGIPEDVQLMTSAGRNAWVCLHQLMVRLDRVLILHGDWKRCIENNFNNYGGDSTAIFLDPPYAEHEYLYGRDLPPVALEACSWAKAHAHLRVALAGHLGDYDGLEDFDCFTWSSGKPSTGVEAIWFSPACLKPIELPNLMEAFG
jgi:D12 class N6 adenine-specific DNA methyltransferase